MLLHWTGLPRRWEMAILLFSGAVIAYTMRVNMSVASQQMMEDLNWTEEGKGYVLSAFYWGYAAGQIYAAEVVHYFGAKNTFGFSILLSGIVTLFVPVASEASYGLTLFIRCLVGLCESAIFPSVYQFIPVWIPLEEKTLMVPFIYSGSYIGNIIGFSVSGLLLGVDILISNKQYGRWHAAFYIFSLLSFAWFPLWMYASYETPEDHPKMTKAELLLINEGKHFHSYESEEKLRGVSIKFTENDEINEKDDSAAPSQVYTSLDIAPNADVESVQIGVSLDGKDGDHDESEAYDEFHSEPILMEHVAHNMISTLSSKKARIDGRSNKHPAHKVPTKLRIVAEKKLKKEFAEHTPWRAFFTHPVALAMYLNSWTSGWIAFTLMSYMPSYLSQVLGFNIESSGILCVFPYIALFISALSFGAIFEYLHTDYNWSIDTIRKAAQTFAYLGSSVSLIICVFLGDKYAGYAFMIITQLMFGAVQSGINCAYSDVAPNYSSSINTIGNLIGAVAGIIGPMVFSNLIQAEPGVWGWRIAFFITTAMAVVSLIVWYIYQTSEPVPALNNPTSAKK